MTEALARIEDLHHSFGGVPALRGFSTTIAPGIITGLIGPDAAGKTTLLRLLAGLLRPEHGRITVLGHDMDTGCHPRARLHRLYAPALRPL